MDWLKCNICFNTYNESNLRPRVLGCGHSFCERCLTNTIQKKSLTCPQCRKVHDINSVADFPINFVLDGLLKSLTPCAENVSDGAISGPVFAQCNQEIVNETNDILKSILEPEKSLSSQKELLKTSAGMCYEHQSNELIFRCSLHKSWVCEKCIEESGDHPKQSCAITSFKEEIEDRKQEYELSLDNEEKSCDKTFLTIEKHISYLSEKKEHHNRLLGILRDLGNLHKNEDEILQSEMKSFEKIVEIGKHIKQKLLDGKAMILQAETLDETNTARDMVENKKVDTRNWLKGTEKEVNEGKLKVQTSINIEMAGKSLLEYIEKFGKLQEKLEPAININEQEDKPLENINLRESESMDKNESNLSEATSYDMCKTHHCQIIHRCLTCERWICIDCIKSHTTVTGCSTINLSKAVNSMKDNHINSLDVMLSIFEEGATFFSSKIQNKSDEIKEMTEKKKELYKQIGKYAEEVEKMRVSLEQGIKMKENLIDSKNHLSATNTPYTVMDRIEVLEERKQSLRSWSMTNLGRDILNIPLNDIPQDVAKALKEKQNVYVEMIVQNKKINGRISSHEDNIYFHTFRLQVLTYGPICMPYDNLMKLLPPRPYLTFIELSLGGVVKGKMILKLNLNLPNLSANMINIVAGTFGKSLVGKKVDHRGDENLGITHVNFSESPFTADTNAISKAKRGDVVVQYKSGHIEQIHFHVAATTWVKSMKVLGSIVSGLDILQECYDNYSQMVVVTDCGLVVQQKEK